VFIINEKGQISQYNNYYKTTYLQINELIDEMFPNVTSNNTYFSSSNYFKPNFNNVNIDELK
jgi:phosphatidate phosphatase PAH1